MNKIYADVSEIEIGSQPDCQWVVLASEVEEMIQVERLRADVAVADCNHAEEAGRKVSELLSNRTAQQELLKRELEIAAEQLCDYEDKYSSLNESLSIWKVRAYEAVSRETALREDLERVSSTFDDLASCVGFSKTRLDQTGDSPTDCANQLQQRLTVAEQYVQKLIDCSKNQDSIATGYLSDILDVIKGNNV